MEGGNNKKLEGIRGWLLVFVIFLVLSTLGEIFITIGNINLIFSPSVGAVNINPTLIVVKIVLTSISIILEITILALILKKKQRAIRWVIVTLVYWVLYTAIEYAFVVQLSNLIFPVLGESVVSIFWILYFKKSKRVKNTLVN